MLFQPRVNKKMRRPLVDPARVRLTMLANGENGVVSVQENGGQVSTVEFKTEVAPEKPKTIRVLERISALLNNAFIEFLATTILLYASVYVPHFVNDPLAQLIPGVAIVAVMMTLKDCTYFCPDGSFMVTITLLCAGAYTKANIGEGTFRDRINEQLNKTQVYDVLIRLFGQGMACVMMYFGVVRSYREALHEVPYHQIVNSDTVCLNEFLSTAVECIATSFCIMPLLRPDSVENKASNPSYSVTFAAKVDTSPPRNRDLFNAAVSLAVMHVVLDRLFRATMNPFVFFMHCEIMGHECQLSEYYKVYLAQVAGLLVAGVYSYNYLPPQKVIASVFGS